MTETGGAGDDARLRWLLVGAWLAGAAVLAATLPAYRGELGPEVRWAWLGFCALAGGAAALGIGRTAPSRGRALLLALPALLVLAAAGAAAYAVGGSESHARGEPILLAFGIALLGAWAVLVAVTAIVSRASWSRPVALGATLVVAGVGFVLVTAQLD